MTKRQTAALGAALALLAAAGAQAGAQTLEQLQRQRTEIQRRIEALQRQQRELPRQERETRVLAGFGQQYGVSVARDPDPDQLLKCPCQYFQVRTPDGKGVLGKFHTGIGELDSPEMREKLQLAVEKARRNPPTFYGSGAPEEEAAIRRFMREQGISQDFDKGEFSVRGLQERLAYKDGKTEMLLVRRDPQTGEIQVIAKNKGAEPDPAVNVRRTIETLERERKQREQEEEQRAREQSERQRQEPQAPPRQRPQGLTKCPPGFVTKGSGCGRTGE